MILNLLNEYSYDYYEWCNLQAISTNVDDFSEIIEACSDYTQLAKSMEEHERLAESETRHLFIERYDLEGMKFLPDEETAKDGDTRTIHTEDTQGT